MTKQMRKTLIAAVTFLGGLYFFLEFILPEKIGSFEFGKYTDQISQGLMVVGVMAIGLGILNVFVVHGSKVVRSQRGWQNSLVLIVSMMIMFVVETLDIIRAEKRLNDSRELFNLAQFVERIDSDYVKNKTEPAPRVTLLRARLESIYTGLEDGTSVYSIPDDSSAKAKKEVLDLRRGIMDLRSSLESLPDAIKADRPEQAAQASALGAEEDGEEAPAPSTPLASGTVAAARQLKALGVIGQDLTKVSYEATLPYKIEHLLKEGLFTQLGAAMFSLLAFYIANAAFRSFRVRSKESALMMVAALIVMLGQIPHGPLYISHDLPALRLWLLKNINTPVNRAIFFGATIAGLAAATRLWLSLERSPLSEESSTASNQSGG